MVPRLLNDSVMPYMTPSNLLTWLRWKLETSTWVLQAYEALVFDRAQEDLPENQQYYLNMIERVSDRQWDHYCTYSYVIVQKSF